MLYPHSPSYLYLDLAIQVSAATSLRPPYNLCSLCWSKLKQCLQAAKVITHEALNQVLTQIVNEQISSDDAWGWFVHCGLFI